MEEQVSSENPPQELLDGSACRNHDAPLSNNSVSTSTDQGKEPGDVSDLNLEIKHTKTGLANAKDESTRASYHQQLGTLYDRRYSMYNAISDSKRAIKNYKAAVKLTRPDDPMLVDRLAGLADAYVTRDLYSDEDVYVDNRIQLLEDCLQIDSVNAPPRRFELLAKAYESRWLTSGDNIEDLNRCIHFFEEFLKFQQDDDLSRQDTLESLGRLYFWKFNHTIDEDDLESSLKIFQEALNLSLVSDAKDDDGRVRKLSGMGDSFKKRFLLLDNMDDLDSAIRRFEEAVSVMTDNCPDKYHVLSELAWSYENRFQILESIPDLNLSVQIRKESLELLPSERNESRSRGYSHIGRLYLQKFDRTNDLPDINEALTWSRKAWDLVRHDDERAAITISHTLEITLLARYKKRGLKVDIDECIQLATEALALAQDRHPDLQPEVHGSLGSSYRAKYRRTKSIKDLEKSIEHDKKATDLCPRDDPELPSNLFALGGACVDKSEKTLKEQDYDLAIQIFQESVELTPEANRYRCIRLHHLAWEHWKRFKRQRDPSDLDKAMEIQRQAFHHVQSFTVDRVEAGKSLCFWLMQIDSIPAAYQRATETLSMVSQVASRSLTVSDKQELLKRISGLSTQVAALALMVGEEPYKAIQHLELGRGIIVGSLNDLRADLDGLQLSHPGMAEQFIKLSEQLDDEAGAANGVANPRYDAAQQLDATIEKIRHLPGFDRFLLAPSEKELMAAAAPGPIIILNIMFLRCDALIIQSDRISSLELPKMNMNYARGQATKREIDSEMLEWLWDTVASPILEFLGYTGMPGQSSWPHVFWIPTGRLSGLPIHAAGYHYPGSTRTVMHRVISGYSSSVRALIQSQKSASRGSITSRPRGRSVLVGVTQLMYAPEEIAELEQLCAEMHLKTDRPKPYRNDVLTSLSECEIFHFAGHGTSHPLDPSKSALIMDDAPVTVQDLFNMKLHSRAPFLAYLSACSTGQIKDENLSDEGLHLIGACQLAGFRHVIGTLRKVDDQLCVQVAKMTYRWIRDCNLSDGSVGEGLHHTIRGLRDQWMGIVEKPVTMRIDENKIKNKSEVNPNAQAEEAGTTSRGVRDVDECEEEPMSWAPFVYFGS